MNRYTTTRVSVPWVLWALCAGSFCARADTQGAPRYYIVLRDVEGPPPGQGAEGDAAQAAALARTLFTEELARHPEVLDGRAAAALPAAGAALGEELKRRHLRGYQFTVRLLGLSRSLNPPPRGKQFRVLERGVKLSLIGTTLPGEQLAVGGDGESAVQADVGARVSEKEERDLLADALRDALAQAVNQSLRKLDRGGAVPPPERRRKH